MVVVSLAINSATEIQDIANLNGEALEIDSPHLLPSLLLRSPSNESTTGPRPEGEGRFQSQSQILSGVLYAVRSRPTDLIITPRSHSILFDLPGATRRTNLCKSITRPENVSPSFSFTQDSRRDLSSTAIVQSPTNSPQPSTSRTYLADHV